MVRRLRLLHHLLLHFRVSDVLFSKKAFAVNVQVVVNDYSEICLKFAARIVLFSPWLAGFIAANLSPHKPSSHKLSNTFD